MGISWVQYLDMVEKQEREAKEIMDKAEREYRQAKAKHDSITLQKQSFLNEFDKLGRN